MPPTRTDRVDEIMFRVGTRKVDRKDWPPYALVRELAAAVKRVHLGEVGMRGPTGVVVDVIHYRDKMQQDRPCYRLTRQGVFVGEYKTRRRTRRARSSGSAGSAGTKRLVYLPGPLTLSGNRSMARR